MSTDMKMIWGMGILTFAILAGGVLLVSAQGEKERQKLDMQLMGDEVAISSAEHLSVGSIKNDTQPPAGGTMYDQTAGPGIKDTQASAGSLNHSLEHGAVIVYYREGLAESDRKSIEEAFLAAKGSKIMTPWKGLDVPVALTSWGRMLKLKTIDQKIIKQFIETNNNRAPEKGMV